MGFKIDDVVHPDARQFANRNFACSVCMCILDEPVQTACDHIFCGSCVRPCLACPTCRGVLSPGDCRSLKDCNKPLLRMLHDLQVFCPHRHGAVAGASRETPAAADGEPAAAADGAIPPQAKRLRLGRAIPPQAKPAAAADGAIPPVAIACDWAGSYADLFAKHLPECSRHPVRCPRGCGEDVPRGELATHAALCAKGWEECSICAERVRPVDMPVHRKMNAEKHVQILEMKLSTEKERHTETVSLRSAIALLGARLLEVESSAKKHKDEIKQVQQQTTKILSISGQGSFAEWELLDVSKMLKECPIGKCRQSPSFRLGELGLFTLEYYPNGTEEAPRNAGIWLSGLNKCKAAFRITIDGESKDVTEAVYGGEYCHGLDNVFPIPRARAAKVVIQTELLSGYRMV